MDQSAAGLQPAPVAASAPGSAGFRFPAWLVALLLALVTVALYWPAMRCGFVNYDDQAYVTSNTHVQKGLTLENIKWAFFQPDVHFGYYHPLTLLSHMLDFQMYGFNPGGHHLTSVLLHAINVALVFLLLRSLTGALWRSAAVAALFAVHPLHVESVAWVAERKDVLSACFGLLTLILYVRYAGQSKIQNLKSKIYYGLALLFFAGSLLSKPMLVTWPFVMLLLDYWPLGRWPRGWRMEDGELRMEEPGRQNIEHREVRERGTEAAQLSTTCPAKPWRRRINSHLSTTWPLVQEKIPFFGLVAVMSVATFVMSKQGGALGGEHLSLGARGGNALISYCRYLGKLFWPAKLAVFYPHPGHWPVSEVLLAGGLLLGLSAVLFWQWQRHPYLLMGWLWFIGTLVPMIGLVQVGDFAMADRYAYIPLLGVLISAVWGAYELTRSRPYLLIPFAVAGATAFVLCLGLARHQLGYWQDSETLFRHTLAVTEDNYLAHNNLGAALYTKGHLDEAVGQFREVVRLNPAYDVGHDNLAAALADKGQLDEAILQYQEALRLKPDAAGIHHILGVDLGKEGRLDEAIAQYREALRMQPDDAGTHNDLGNALDSEGHTDAAITQYQEAIRLEPDGAEAHGNLGAAFGKRGRIDEAIPQLLEAVRLKPDDVLAHYNLGMALHQKGRPDEAISQYQEALRLKPDFAEARANLKQALKAKSAPAAH